MKKVYVLILNYNGWKDTIECLESILRNNYLCYQLIVIDNNSPNNSLRYIKAWAKGKMDIWIKPDNQLRDLSYPPVPKPLPYVQYSREEAEKGGNPILELKTKRSTNAALKYPLIFIQSGDNLGFAAGNNVGLRYALSINDFDYIWLLNNDTVVDKDALFQLIQKAEQYKNKGYNIGIIGSKLLYYENPKIIQGIAGKLNFDLPRVMPYATHTK